MIRWKALSVTLLASASLFSALLPGVGLAESTEPTDDVPNITAGLLRRISAEKSEQDEALLDQIKTTYDSAKKRAKVKSFKGKCGKYVNQQLVVLGINKKYIACNGNREYNLYCKKRKSSGGYAIHAYGAKKYSLEDALNAIAKEDPEARNILVGFEKGTSKASKKYGHTLFIHGIKNGCVYFSDSFAQAVDGVRYAEGAPIVCTIERFCRLYQRYRFDGVIWFN